MKTQIWIAITIYVLVAIIKKQLKLEPSLYSLLQILSITLFEKTPLFQVLLNNPKKTHHFSKQLNYSANVDTTISHIFI